LDEYTVFTGERYFTVKEIEVFGLTKWFVWFWDYIHQHKHGGQCQIQKNWHYKSLIIIYHLRIEWNSNHNIIADRNEYDIWDLVIEHHMICSSFLITESGNG
jgi:hypothetical protein